MRFGGFVEVVGRIGNKPPISAMMCDYTLSHSKRAVIYFQQRLKDLLEVFDLKLPHIVFRKLKGNLCGA
jgi:hypothetical protein